MGERKKVLQICTYFLKTQLFNTLFKRLNDTDNECYTYCPHSVKSVVGWDVEKDKAENVTVSQCFNQIDRLFFFTKNAKVFNDLEKNYSLSEFDCIYAHSLFSSGYVANRIKEKYNVHYIVAVCNTDVNVFFKYGFWLRKTGVKVLLNAEKIVFISESYKSFVKEKYISDDILRIFEEKSVTIPFGIDDFWLEEKCVHTHKDEKSVRIVSTGRIEPNKNQLITAKACELLKNEGYKVKLTLIGKVTNEKYLSQLQKYDFVDYAGEKSFEEMKEIYKSQDVFVMPSVHETFGLVYGEAMSQGLPVVYSKGQGFDEQFPEGEVGFHVESGSASEVAGAIKKIMADYNNISERCKEQSEKLNWTEIAKTYLDIFKNIR